MTSEEIRKTIRMINKHQKNSKYHPLTCGNDSTHSLLIPKEIAGVVILVCPDCIYTQKYIPI